MEKASAPQPETPTIPNPTGGTVGGSTGGSTGTTTDRYNWPNGGTTELVIQDVSTLSDFWDRPINLPVGSRVNAKMNLVMAQQSTNTYWGTISIAFEEYGANGSGTSYDEKRFRTSYTLNYNKVNGFFTANGQYHFKAFTQDLRRAVLIVIDRADDSGLMTGRLYYHKFSPAYPPQGPMYADACWMIRRGPYDCRDYLIPYDDDGDRTDTVDDMVMRPETAVNPYRNTNGTSFYQLLGTFEGLNGSKALNL